MINTAKTLKGSFLKSHPNSKKKPSKLYTEIIFQDDYLFHHIKVKGHSVQTLQACNEEGKDALQSTEAQKMEHKEKNLLSPKLTRQVKWLKKSNTTDGNIKSLQEAGFLRSRTEDNALKHKKSNSEVKNSLNMNKSTVLGDPYPRISYKEQNLNDQVYCNFKSILDEFNKVKGKSKKNFSVVQQKNEGKVFKKSYKKPNFYNYQEFYRQNYQAKQIQQSGIWFNKFELSKSQNDNDKSKLLGSVKPIPTPSPRSPRSSGKKYDKVCVCIDSKKMSLTSKPQNEMHLQAQMLASHYTFKNKTERNRIKKERLLSLNKTSMEGWSGQHQKIQPWKSIDQFQISL